MDFDPPGPGGPAGQVADRGCRRGHRQVPAALELSHGGELFCELTAAQAAALAVQIEHPHVADPLALQPVLGCHAGGDLGRHPALEQLLYLWAVVGQVVLKVQGRLQGPVENGLKPRIGLLHGVRLHRFLSFPVLPPCIRRTKGIMRDNGGRGREKAPPQPAGPFSYAVSTSWILGTP